jgi:hypothetical protein
MYTNTQQLHGVHAQHIKNEWPCQQHLGENGRPGACYVTPDGNHIGLNIRRLAAWAAAMVCYLAYVLRSNADSLSTRLPEKPQNISLPTFLTLMVPMALGLLCRDRVGALVLWHKLMPGHPQLLRRKP